MHKPCSLERLACSRTNAAMGHMCKGYDLQWGAVAGQSWRHGLCQSILAEKMPVEVQTSVMEITPLESYSTRQRPMRESSTQGGPMREQLIHVKIQHCIAYYMTSLLDRATTETSNNQSSHSSSLASPSSESPKSPFRLAKAAARDDARSG